jgi:hypothetical protein
VNQIQQLTPAKSDYVVSCEMDQEKDLIGRLEFEPVRAVFHDEARHFTTWLEQHLEVLGERLGIELTWSSVKRQLVNSM